MFADTVLHIEEQLCFALYAATNAMTRNYRALLAEFGLTYPQYLVVLTLMERSTMTSGDLARTLRLDAGTLTPMLKRLAAAGLIRRTRRSDDERVIDNTLTDAGLALHDNMVRAQTEVRSRTGLSEDNLVSLRHTLHDLTETLNHASKELEIA